ncbi:MAG TPA: hypothetical protein H9699_02405 [Candidatus Gemmiger stercoravium]|nr:hypothetical protein [Candidatus Gemmiger stercoravium]
MPALFYLILILAALILVPCVGLLLRKRDFERQVRGQRPERPAGNAAEPKPDLPDMSDAQQLADEARLKSLQNGFTNLTL